MENSVTGTLLLIITGIITYKGFRDNVFFERYLFEVDGILVGKEYDRTISSGFLHANWIHFGFNMIALLSFSISLELLFGYWKFLGIYFFSMLGGSLLALYIHRNHGDYRAVGASGAVSGVIFSSIILFPESSISFVILPISIKSWIMGLIFVLVSIFGIKSRSGNIGHEAHLGGALTGVICTLLIEPAIIRPNWWIILLLVVPTTLFLILIIRNPAVLLIDNYWGESIRNIRNRSFGREGAPPGQSREEELNELLDKIRKSGINSLTSEERRRLDELKDDLL